MSLPILRTFLLVTALTCVSSVTRGQLIDIQLPTAAGGFIQIDSSNWNEAWIEVDGRDPGLKSLAPTDVSVTEGDTKAEVLSIDSIGTRYQSHLALSMMLDNSSSMFHAYDSLTRYCDTLLTHLPKGIALQALTFDDNARSESHLYTKRPSVFIAQSGFRDSAAVLSKFWHFFDSVRTRYTPLYDAIAAAVSNIESRRLNGGDPMREDVLLVVTDGEDNASRVDIETLYDIVRTAHVRLFTINFRTGADARLVWLARHTNGEHYYADNLHDLQDVLNQIARSMTRKYYVRYRFASLSPSSSGGR